MIDSNTIETNASAFFKVILKDESKSNVKDEVVFLSGVQNAENFEDGYVEIRRKEGRILEEKEINLLPNLPWKHRYHGEWKLRKDSLNRFLAYVGKRKIEGAVLDLGCGNGWFTNQMSQTKAPLVLGMDVNIHELNQANAIFRNERLKFCYGDIFDRPFQLESFRLITLNASVQYFSSFSGLINELLSLLEPSGEIHIIDSPFYKPSQVAFARQRTEEYYGHLGMREFSKNYFHRSWPELEEFDYQVKYMPGLRSRLLNNSPFPWIIINKM